MSDLPKPRLELRWRRPNAREAKKNFVLGRPDWICDYELILPLGEPDIRRKGKKDYLALKLGGTSSKTSASEMIDAPYRDGAHSSWDSEALGGIPVYVIGSDGIARQKIRNADGCGYKLQPPHPRA